jgi:hypothetical protein
MDFASGLTRSPRPFWHWKVGERKTNLLCAVVVAVSASHLLICLQVILQRGAYPFGDFFAIWSYARMVFAGHAADLYDAARMHDAQLALGLPTAQALGLSPSAVMPFAYPPIFLPMLWPLALFSYPVAAGVWLGGTLALYVWAVCHRARPLWLFVLFAIVAPTTAVNLSFGQSGFLCAALLIGGLRLVDARPVLAGVLFGLLAYKAQFGLLVPVALVAARQWRCLASAGVTVVALAGATAIAFGEAIWSEWLRSLPTYAAWFDQHTRSAGVRVSVRDTLRMLGVAPDAAAIAQALAVVGGLVVAWVSFRRDRGELAVATVVAATCLAAPHALVYDMVMLTGAVLLYMQHRLGSGAAFSLLDIAIILLVLVVPAAMAWGAVGPMMGLAAILLFVARFMIASMAESSVPRLAPRASA